MLTMTAVPYHRESPPLRILLGLLVVETVVSVGTLAWRLAKRLRR